MKCSPHWLAMESVISTASYPPSTHQQPKGPKPPNITTKTNLFFSSISKTKPLSHTLSIFPLLPRRDTVTWNTALSACLRHRRPLKALGLFLDMLISSPSLPDSITLRSVLRACLQCNCCTLPAQIHAYVLKMRHTFSDTQLTVIYTCLLNVYLGYGRVELAHDLFVTIPERDVVTYTSMLKGFVEAVENERALGIFVDMVEREGEDLIVNEHAYSCALRACAGMCCLFVGQQVHARVVKSMLGSDVFVGTGLVDLYVKCGEMRSARRAFDEIARPNVVSYNAMLAGNLEGDEGLRLFADMRMLGMDLDHVTFASVLRACKGVGICSVRQLHGLVVKMMEAESDVFLSCALFEAYLDSGRFGEARKVFDRMKEKDVASFNLAIQGYLRNGHEAEAMKSFIKALRMGKEVRESNATSILMNGSLDQGMQLHSLIIKHGCSDESVIGS